MELQTQRNKGVSLVYLRSTSTELLLCHLLFGLGWFLTSLSLNFLTYKMGTKTVMIYVNLPNTKWILHKLLAESDLSNKYIINT